MNLSRQDYLSGFMSPMATSKNMASVCRSWHPWLHPKIGPQYTTCEVYLHSMVAGGVILLEFTIPSFKCAIKISWGGNYRG